MHRFNHFGTNKHLADKGTSTYHVTYIEYYSEQFSTSGCCVYQKKRRKGRGVTQILNFALQSKTYVSICIYPEQNISDSPLPRQQQYFNFKGNIVAIILDSVASLQYSIQYKCSQIKCQSKTFPRFRKKSNVFKLFAVSVKFYICH